MDTAYSSAHCVRRHSSARISAQGLPSTSIDFAIRVSIGAAHFASRDSARNSAMRGSNTSHIVTMGFCAQYLTTELETRNGFPIAEPFASDAYAACPTRKPRISSMHAFNLAPVG